MLSTHSGGEWYDFFNLFGEISFWITDFSVMWDYYGIMNKRLPALSWKMGGLKEELGIELGHDVKVKGKKSKESRR